MQGQTHEKYMRNIPYCLSKGGAQNEANFVQQNIELMASAVKSPDQDYLNFKIPTNLFPASIRAQIPSYAVPFWEHCLPNDCPTLLTDFLRLMSSSLLHMTFMWADGTLNAWYTLAKNAWATNRQTALYHLARCCHLVEDLHVPHHTTIWGNLIEFYRVMLNQGSIQTTYEKYVDAQFKSNSTTYGLAEYTSINIPQIAVTIANASRGYMYLCDGVALPQALLNSIFRNLLYSVDRNLQEDFYTCAQYSNNGAMKYTTLLIHKFFREVNF
jgi:hypothetical protein